jgi:[protein-PII] uridylyltransferase
LGPGKCGGLPAIRQRRNMAGYMLRRSELPSPSSVDGLKGMTRFAGEVRDAYRDFLGRLERRHRAGMDGLEVARACSGGVETVILHLYETLRSWMGRGARHAPTIVAIGGFGRRELSPKSDVDLLFLTSSKRSALATSFTGYLVRMLWDSGLELGHSVRSLGELRRALKTDLDLKTALLDGRWICGDEGLKADVAALKSRVRETEGGGLLAGKLDETRRRWRKYGGSYHLIEPNIKESPGGLRDYQTMRWIGMVLPWSGTLEGLYRLAVIDRGEIVDIQRAFDFLLRTRNELQFFSLRNWNVLTVDVQRTVAEGLGYGNEEGFLAVERFMIDYYTNSRSIYRALERFLAETHGRGALRIFDGALYRRVGAKHLDQLDVRLRRDKMESDPLFPFKEQLESGRRLSPHLERRIRGAFGQKPVDRKMIRRMRVSFCELLLMPGRKAPVIRSMHELGVLKHIFPPFEKLTCLKRYDLYHHYTADEHSLQAVSHLEELGDREGGLLPRLYSEVAEKTELYLATLLHDIGKSAVRGHASTGARMVEELLAEFPLPAKTKSTVVFLVRNHLLLSHFSQRRDMEDLDTSLQFIRRIKNHINLKLLYLLTYADLKATGTGVWTGWKENLLEDLYYKAGRILAEKTEQRSSYGRMLETRREKMLAACGGRSQREDMEAHLAGLPARYLMVVSPPQGKIHLKMINSLKGSPAVTNFRRLRHSIELIVCTRDRPYRLSQLCGVITISDFNILGAYAFTREDGIVIDLFHIENLEGGLALSSGAREKIERALSGALRGKIDLEEAYGLHVKKWKRKIPPTLPIPCTVEFENDLSRESTIIDLTARDRPGLLYRITRILSEEDLDIQSAQITTRGGLVADSFYVRTAVGGKLEDTAAMRRVRTRLVRELAD